MARRPTTDEQTLEYIRFIQSGVTRLETLIRDLLGYSPVVERQRDGRGGRSARSARRDSSSIVQASIEESKTIVTADTLPPVSGRRSQLVQLFQNLIGNAIKYRSARPPRIHIGVEPAASGDWLFAIRDNGIGLDMRFAETIFGVFKRLHSRSEYPGTGIGLATCKRIVEIHGGAIWVESQVGEGTTFYFRLPARAANGSPVDGAASRSSDADRRPPHQTLAHPPFPPPHPEA